MLDLPGVAEFDFEPILLPWLAAFNHLLRTA